MPPHLTPGVKNAGLAGCDVGAEEGVVPVAEGGWHEDTDILAVQLTLLVPEAQDNKVVNQCASVIYSVPAG